MKSLIDVLAIPIVVALYLIGEKLIEIIDLLEQSFVLGLQ